MPSTANHIAKAWGETCRMAWRVLRKGSSTQCPQHATGNIRCTHQDSRGGYRPEVKGISNAQSGSKGGPGGQWLNTELKQWCWNTASCLVGWAQLCYGPRAEQQDSLGPGLSFGDTRSDSH